jgi:TRAP-type transport system periplasmic protein
MAASAAAFASIGVVRSPAKAAQFEFKCGAQNPPEHPSCVRGMQMWAAVEQESGGRIHTQFFPNAVLGGPVAMFSQLRLGALHFLQDGPGDLEVADISLLGFTYKDQDDAFRVMDGPLGRYIRQEIASKGLYALPTIWNSGMYQITSATHPIHTPDDLAGFKIRVAEAKITIDLFKALGASPTVVSYPEIYTALQTKIVEGVAASLATTETARWYEVQKYIALTNHAFSGLWILANGDVWKSIPPDLQAIIERNNTKYGMLERGDTKSLNASLVSKLATQGLVLNQVNQAPFRAHLGSYFKDWSSTYGPTMWGLLERSLGHKVA